MVTFLHTGDLHLGLRLTRFEPDIAKKIREARFQALEKIRDAAKERKVDFVLIAGDLFDDHAVDFDIAKRAFDLLESFPTPVYVLSGNHDPLLAGSVWDRPPWSNSNPKRVHLIREPEALQVVSGVLLFPCPVLRKTSLSDPTAWIAEHAVDAGTVRIGMAHGSLKIRDDLPADDHLIAMNAAHDLHLDYLALGHWHSRKLFRDSEGIERTAYCGVHEPMRFPSGSEYGTGWIPYSGGSRAEFLDRGKGEVLLVSIQQAGMPPSIEPLEVGHLFWGEESRRVTSNEELSRLIDEIGTWRPLERRLLKLKLEGVLDAQAMLRLSQLREVMDRYLFAEIDKSGLHLQPTEEEIREVAGQGVLRSVLDKLRAEAEAQDGTPREVAQRAFLLLYQVAQEAQA